MLVTLTGCGYSSSSWASLWSCQSWSVSSVCCHQDNTWWMEKELQSGQCWNQSVCNQISVYVCWGGGPYISPILNATMPANIMFLHNSPPHQNTKNFTSNLTIQVSVGTCYWQTYFALSHCTMVQFSTKHYVIWTASSY